MNAANNLHHLSMIYAGAVMELAQGKPIGMIPLGTPGLKTMRDLADLILFTRAEINGLTRILVEAKIVTVEQVTKIMEDEYKHLTAVKAKQFGVKVEDQGLVFKVGKG